MPELSLNKIQVMRLPKSKIIKISIIDSDNYRRHKVYDLPKIDTNEKN